MIGDTVKDCPGRALLGFLRGTPFKDCPRENVPAPVRLAPRRLADAHRWPRLGRAAGRILRATIATLTDVRADADLAGLGPQGGLRRGWFAVGFDGLRLHGVVSVSGLAVSGLLQGGGTSKLTVRAGVTRGTLRVRPGLITGTIGRARIRARLRG